VGPAPPPLLRELRHYKTEPYILPNNRGKPRGEVLSAHSCNFYPQ